MTTTIRHFNFHLTGSLAAGNTRLAQWGLTFYNQKSGYYCTFVVVDNLVFQNPPLRQAWERCMPFYGRPC